MYKQLKGMEKQIELVATRNDLKDIKWPDFQVSSWPFVEVMQQRMQTDMYVIQYK